MLAGVKDKHGSLFASFIQIAHLEDVEDDLGVDVGDLLLCNQDVLQVVGFQAVERALAHRLVARDTISTPRKSVGQFVKLLDGHATNFVGDDGEGFSFCSCHASSLTQGYKKSSLLLVMEAPSYNPVTDKRFLGVQLPHYT